MNFNLKSPQQVGLFLYNYLQLKPVKYTAGGKRGFKVPSTDESVLIEYAEKHGIEFCKLVLQYKKFEKALGTYCADIIRHIQERTINGQLFYLIHPDFNLNTTETFRSSCTGPNLQNQPHHGDILTVYNDYGKRNKHESIEWRVIRKIFVGRGNGWLITEVDYQGSEVKGAANLSEDPQLIDDLNNDMDMHSHWTNVIFGWDRTFDDIKKNYEEERHIVKNNWTFANFFGAGAKSIAESFRKFDVYRNFVEDKFNQKSKKSTSDFHEYFETYSQEHFQECQEKFFERYSVYKTWQDQLVRDYYENGYVETPLGFRRYAPLKRNEILNFPIQATSYHLLQYAINNAQQLLIEGRAKSYLIGQIHDSALGMVRLEELNQFMEIVNHQMINHDLPIAKKAKLGTDWKVGKNWLNMYNYPFKRLKLERI